MDFQEHDDTFRLRARGPLGWAMYDYVYSLCSFLLLTTGVTPWVIDDLGHPDAFVSLTQVCVAAFELALMPLLGAFADRTGRRLQLFGWLTWLSAVAGAALGVIGTAHVLPILVLAGLSLGLLQFGFAQYEPLLPSIAPVEHRGRVSGLATAVGFLGVMSATAIGIAFNNKAHRQELFIPNACILLVGSALCYLAIRARTGARVWPADAPASASSDGTRRSLLASWRTLRRHPRAVRLLISKFLYTDAIGTVITYLVVYMHRLGGISGALQEVVLGLGVICGAIGAAIVGKRVERIGPKRPLMVVLPIFAATIFVGAAIGQTWTVWAMAPVVGGSLGTVWTADRVFMLRLIPAHECGELFGFFNIVNRAAGSIGPLILWSGVIYALWNATHTLDALNASRVALCALAVSAFAGWLIVRGLSDEPMPVEQAGAASS